MHYCEAPVHVCRKLVCSRLCEGSLNCALRPNPDVVFDTTIRTRVLVTDTHTLTKTATALTPQSGRTASSRPASYIPQPLKDTYACPSMYIYPTLDEIWCVLLFPFTFL